MANKKISQLSATTEANDNVFLVMNNSGNTETFRIKRSDLLSGTSSPAGFIQGDASQSLVPYYFETSAATTADTTYVDNLETLGSVQVPLTEKIQVGAGQYTEITNNQIKQQGSGAKAILGASNATTTTLSVAIAGASHSISSGRSLVGVGFGTKTINGGIANLNLSDGSVVDNSSQVGIVGGEENNITSSDFTGMLSGNKNTITNSTSSQMVGGSGNTISGLDNVVILGGSGISATTSNTTYVDKLFSVGKTISVNGGGIRIIDEETTASSNNGRAQLGGINNTFNAGFGGTSIGGRNTTNAGKNNHLLGGFSNSITGEDNAIVVGRSNQIATAGEFNTILGGRDNTIGGAAFYTSILGGRNNTITHNHSVMLGGFNNTSLYTKTAHAEHLLTYGQISNGYYDNLSGDTFTIDWDNGNSQKVYMTGATSLDFTNVRDGATYKLQVVNGGTHSITGATASGYTILCEGGNIPNITNNGVDLCVLEVMDTDILVRHFADFSAP